MLYKSELEEILYVALKSGADFAEIFLEEINGTSITCEDNKTERITSGIEIGAGIRVVSGDTMGYACTTDLSLISLKKTAEKAAAGIKKSPKNIKIDLIPAVPIQVSHVTRRPNEVGIEEKVAVVHTLNKVARSYGDKVKQVMARYADSNQSVTIANSNGVYVEDNRIRTRYFVNVIAAKDNILQTGLEAPGGTLGFELTEKYQPEKIARIATERALLMLDAPHAPAGKMTVVMSHEAGGTMVHEACGHALEADFIMKGTSVFAGRVGEKVASEFVTVVDDGTYVGNYGYYNFDDEGTPAQKNILIENGILKGFLSNRYTAEKLGLKPSGNGRRESFRSKPIPRMTNTFIAPGTHSPQEIIASIKNGLYVKSMGGGEVNVVNGDFVFEVSEGYLIKNGKIKHPVRGAMLTGNGPKVLQIIDLVGDDLGFHTGVCGKYDHAPVSTGQPTIRIPEVVVGGRV
ncbi:peptidase C69 [candidate division WOR-1 bacterium RIFOXYB2_FULL_42_35]|uniref:Peptidase C69 n=1 Tax=candidate division WOR-1 bacterium RIFOXYC2_FULL_41_25 TaxID=1802586 RepID=A0A1F4TKR0_UNCSA|nr:MAG: peptidase C69 [candidate division WOR-1 bacterium RIFOXYA2_FULL_41_14]OGC22748.1 MAG: peptidase C69 [candidate division WOR-1 bacterium RIFOXYB2_FULL_42_35]OGC33169.1 MAG: peptidase C69 [candidate division WOR-1 bacterium RIFOXYC2_FULL_41_25]